MSILNRLFEAVYYGADLEFTYNGNYYLINSGKIIQNNTEEHLINVFKSNESFYEGENCSACEEIYSACKKEANNNTNIFFETKLFDGKSLYEIINDIADINY